MNDLIAAFTAHLRKAIEIGSKTEFRSADRDIQNVLICGLGGSGIGGTIIAQLLSKQTTVPISTNKTYTIPNYVNENTLVIASSYSGNTEETLSMAAAAAEKGAEICCISSGGKFIKLATEKGYNYIQIPGGLPPRAAFGYAFPQLLFIFQKYALLNGSYADANAIVNDLEAAMSLLDSEEENIQAEAVKAADQIFGKLPVIYADADYEGVATRFRQQVNENAKMLAWHHVIPEMNHNELVGWRSDYQNLAVVFFRNGSDHERNQHRMKHNQGVMENYTSTIVELWSKGDTEIAKSLYLIHLGDWISYHLATKKGVDVVEVDVITGLKNMLANI